MEIYSVGSFRYLPAPRASHADSAEASGAYQSPTDPRDTVRLSVASVERANVLKGLLYEVPEEPEMPPEEAAPGRSALFSMSSGDIVSGLGKYRSAAGGGAESASLVNKFV